MLTGHIETPCEITLIGFGEEKNEYNARVLGLIKEVFEDAQKEYPNDFKIIYKEK